VRHRGSRSVDEETNEEGQKAGRICQLRVWLRPLGPLKTGQRADVLSTMERDGCVPRWMAREDVGGGFHG
jgi:hypothetical protein